MREKQKGDNQKRVKGRQERAKRSLKVYICFYISAAFKHGWQLIIPLHSWYVATVAPEPLFPFKPKYFPRSETKKEITKPLDNYISCRLISFSFCQAWEEAIHRVGVTPTDESPLVQPTRSQARQLDIEGDPEWGRVVSDRLVSGMSCLFWIYFLIFN